MAEDWQSDLKDSNYDFMRLVWDSIKEFCGGGTITPVEVAVNNELARQLDVDAGIDIWQVVGGHGVRGIASRIQWGPDNWHTFTIRKSRFSGARTEYEKRLLAIQGGEWLYPYFTCQAYVAARRTGGLLGCAVARTKDLFDALEAGKGGERETSNARFRWVFWSDVPGVFWAGCELLAPSQRLVKIQRKVRVAQMEIPF